MMDYRATAVIAQCKHNYDKAQSPPLAVRASTNTAAWARLCARLTKGQSRGSQGDRAQGIGPKKGGES